MLKLGLNIHCRYLMAGFLTAAVCTENLIRICLAAGIT